MRTRSMLAAVVLVVLAVGLNAADFWGLDTGNWSGLTWYADGTKGRWSKGSSRRTATRAIMRPNVRANPPCVDGRLARASDDEPPRSRGQGGRPRRVGG